MTTDKRSEPDKREDGPPTRREAQQPIGPVDGDDTRLSGEDDHDPQRDDAAEDAAAQIGPRDRLAACGDVALLTGTHP